MGLQRKSAGTELIDLLDRVLDKGIVVDASSRLRLAAPNLFTHNRHMVVASIETYLKHTEARAVAKLNARRPMPAAKDGRKSAAAQVRARSVGT